MFLLYRSEAKKINLVANIIENDWTVSKLKPTPLKLKESTEELAIKTILLRLYLWLITGGKFAIYYLWIGNELAHISYVVPSCCKFPFLEKGEYEIGPCVTMEKFRRRGCYVYMLNYITSLITDSGCAFYMIVESANLPSVRGIEKSGFVYSGVLRKNILKNYIKDKEDVCG